MRYQLIAAALVVGLVSPAVAQNRTLPAGSEQAAQPPIDWSTETARTLGHDASLRGPLGRRRPVRRRPARGSLRRSRLIATPACHECGRDCASVCPKSPARGDRWVNG